MLDIKKTVDGKKVTLQLTGMLDTISAPELDELLTELYPEMDELELDFSTLDYISSAGLRVILMAKKTMMERGDMKISNANEDVYDIFEATGLLDLLEAK